MNTTIHRPLRLMAALAVAAALVITGCSEKSDSDGSGGSTPGGGGKTTIRISSQGFSENQTLAQVYGQYLAEKGYETDIQDPIGTRAAIYQALGQGKIDFVVDYVGDAANELSADSGTADADASYKALTASLKTKKLTAGALGDAVDSNALVALKSWAEENKVTKISDLANVSGTLTLGALAECESRAVCLVGYNGDPYHLDLKFKIVEYGPAQVEALKSNTIQVAQYGTSGPEISTGSLVVLEDDKGLQPAGNIVPVFRDGALDQGAVEALNELTAQVTTEDLVAWNQATDVDKSEPADVATAWLKDKGLI